MALLHFEGHFGCGGGSIVSVGIYWGCVGVVDVGIQGPQSLSYGLQVVSQLPLMIASLHFDGHCAGVVVASG